jgi:hypothetical protein
LLLYGVGARPPPDRVRRGWSANLRDNVVECHIPHCGLT